MAPVGDPLVMLVGLMETSTTALMNQYSDQEINSNSSTAAAARRNSAPEDKKQERAPSRHRWGSVKSWMFGQLLASSFARVSLEASNSSCPETEEEPAASSNNNDWDCSYAKLKPSVSASSSSSTLYTDADEDEQLQAPLVFDIVRVIGSGSYGTVVLSRLQQCPDRLFAIKVIHKRKFADCSERDAQRLRTEKNVLCALDHPFITKLYCSFETKESLNFVMEYCAGGDMYFLLEKFPKNRLPESYVVFYAASIALALNYLHHRGVVYRDLKPENILLDKDGFLRLADFGFARDQIGRHDQACMTFCGSADYIAPEVVRGQGYGMAADLWSFGCVIYELLTGFPPFYCPKDRGMLFRKIEREQVTFPSHFSRPVCDLLSGLLQKDASKRLGNGPHGMDDVFTHPFFASIDWYQLSTKQAVPPMTPKVSSPTDTSNFESQFTKQRAEGQLVYDPLQSVQHGGAGVPILEEHYGHEQQSHSDRFGFEDFDWCADVSNFR